MQAVEKAIKILEYCLSLSKWGIDCLRNFPIYEKEKGNKINGGDIKL